MERFNVEEEDLEGTNFSHSDAVVVIVSTDESKVRRMLVHGSCKHF